MRQLQKRLGLAVLDQTYLSHHHLQLLHHGFVLENGSDMYANTAFLQSLALAPQRVKLHAHEVREFLRRDNEAIHFLV